MDNKKPLVSIITPTYNSEDTIDVTLKSVESQTYQNIEHIIIDGDSKDKTLKKIKSNINTVDKLVSEKDEGIFDAMNKGIRVSEGKIIGILNSDDWYEGDAVEQAVNLFRNNESLGLVHGDLRIWGQDNTQIGVWESKEKPAAYLSVPYNHPTCFVRRKVYENVGMFNTEFKTAADYDFMLRFLRSEFSSVATGSVLTNFRQGGTSSGPPPILQLYSILRKNNYPFYKIMLGLGYRLSRYSVSAISGFFE